MEAKITVNSAQKRVVLSIINQLYFRFIKLNAHPLKTGTYSVLLSVLSNMAICLCFVPFLFLGWKKIRQVNTYRVLGIYWLLNGLVNLPLLQMAGGPHGLQSRLSRFHTMAEAPLLLLAFASACSGRQRRRLLLVTLLYITGECSLVGVKGYTLSTCSVIIGSGLLLILLYCITRLVQYVKKMEHNRFENSMVYIYAAHLFAYGSFLIIFLFAHFRPAGSSNNDTDSFLLYYISLLLSAIVTATGIWSYGIRRKPHRHRPVASRYSSSSS